MPQFSKRPHRRLIAFIILLSCLFHTGAAFAQVNYERLVIFGDSLSDTGNLASIATGFPYPFYENRISDGPVLVDYLAAELGLNARASEENNGTNFSVAGGNILGTDREDLSSQVDDFLSRGALGDQQSLYFLMMGGNDLRDIRGFTSAADAELRINDVVAQFESQLNRLYDAGARTFLIANVANIGRIPETLSRQATDPQIAERAATYVRAYNAALAQRLDVFELKRGVSLKVFDLFAELERILDNADEFGFTQTEIGCFDIDGFQFASDCLFGTRFDRFVFFDNIHPTGKTNQLASAALIGEIPMPNPNSNSRDLSLTAIVTLLLLD